MIIKTQARQERSDWDKARREGVADAITKAWPKRVAIIGLSQAGKGLLRISS